MGVVLALINVIQVLQLLLLVIYHVPVSIDQEVHESVDSHDLGTRSAVRGLGRGHWSMIHVLEALVSVTSEPDLVAGDRWPSKGEADPEAWQAISIQKASRSTIELQATLFDVNKGASHLYLG
jgi:hypothetical protein